MNISPSHPTTSIALLALLIFLIGASAQGQSTVTGFVFGPDRNPVQKARVELYDSVNRVKRTETDSSGRFIFISIGVGRFQLRVTSPGSELEEYTDQVEISGGAIGGYETVQVEVRMRLRKAAAISPVTRVVFAQDIPEEAKKDFQTAVAELEKNRSAPAIEALEKAVAVFPSYFAALEILGVEYMKAKMYDKARLTFTTAVAVNARSFNGWYGLTYANFATERFAEALDAAGKATEIDKNAAEVYFVIGMSQRKLKLYDAAEKAFLKAKELDKGRTPDINWNLALLYAHNLHQYGKAADELELFLKATPDNPDAAQIKKLIANFRSKQYESK